MTSQSDQLGRTARRALGWSVVDGLLHSVMLGVSESYLGAFAVELGHDDAAVALLATVPPLVGALAQLAAPMLSVWLGSRKRLVVTGATLQALSHLGLIAIARAESQSLILLLAVKMSFWISGMVIGPPWNAWMASLTEHVSRARYFVWRSTACHVALLLSFLWSGRFLASESAGSVHSAFATLFSVGLVARAAAAVALGLQSDPPPPPDGGALLERLREAVARGPWKLAMAIGLLQFGAHVSVPFFTPYMLRTLELQLSTFALLTSISIVGKALSLPLWGVVCRRVGLSVAMTFGVVGIALVPALWVMSPDLAALIWVHVFSGVAWAGFEYASLQLLLGNAPKSSAVEFFSLSSTLSGALQLTGSMVGTALLSSGFDYHGVFLISSGLRIVPVLLLTPLAITLARGLPLRRLWMRLVSVRPAAGVERRPLMITPREEDLSPPPNSSR